MHTLILLAIVLILIAIVVYLVIDGIASGRRHSRVLSVIRSEIEGLRREVAAKIPPAKTEPATQSKVLGPANSHQQFIDAQSEPNSD